MTEKWISVGEVFFYVSSSLFNDYYPQGPGMSCLFPTTLRLRGHPKKEAYPSSHLGRRLATFSCPLTTGWISSGSSCSSLPTTLYVEAEVAETVNESMWKYVHLLYVYT